MYCSKCGNQLREGSEFCPQCGEQQNHSQQRVETELTVPSQKKNSKLPIILLSIGAGLSLLIFLISWIAYGKVYFFNGYAITMIGWIVSFALTGAGIVLSVLNFIKGGRKTRMKRQLISIVSLVAVIPVILICSSVINGGSKSSSSTYYSPSSNDIQNAYESCHSTAEHKQAIFSYDINNDNYLSSYELELFAKAHPRFVNDKEFMAWMESMTD